ncbi:uncharacterized protein LOC5514702 [Nematostella vectensis]|nr:uncharacterized protein LOC5514702 [Nematostella vectensis]
MALRQRNDTILGVNECLIQLFKNPNGNYFEVITADAANIKQQGGAFTEHSWFPGYAWRIAVCPRCGAHLGWSFEDPLHTHEEMHRKEKTSHSSDSKYSFVGLIYPNLIQQNYADSLIITPKSYRS